MKQMSKQVIRLSENKLKGIIRQSVKRYLNEWTDFEDVDAKWDKVKEILGVENFLSEIHNYMSTDDIEEMLDHISRMHDIDYFYPDDTDEDEQEEYEYDEMEDL